MIEENKIFCGDCVEIMKQMPNEYVDMVLTSPPYDKIRNYHGYNFDITKTVEELYRILKKGGIIVWVVGDAVVKGNKTLTSFRQAILFQEHGFNVHDVMIYKKKNTPFMRSNAYTNCFEYMFVFSKGKPKTFNPITEKTKRNGFEMLVCNKRPDGVNHKVLKELKTKTTKTNIWEYAVGLGGSTNDKIAFRHPAIFPEKLAEDHILSWSNENDIIFDPFVGSGTTCKIAQKYNRKYIGCDISQEYVNIALERLQKSKAEANLF